MSYCRVCGGGEDKSKGLVPKTRHATAHATAQGANGRRTSRNENNTKRQNGNEPKKETRQNNKGRHLLDAKETSATTRRRISVDVLAFLCNVRCLGRDEQTIGQRLALQSCHTDRMDKNLSTK